MNLLVESEIFLAKNYIFDKHLHLQILLKLLPVRLKLCFSKVVLNYYHIIIVLLFDNKEVNIDNKYSYLQVAFIVFLEKLQLF